MPFSRAPSDAGGQPVLVKEYRSKLLAAVSTGIPHSRTHLTKIGKKRRHATAMGAATSNALPQNPAKLLAELRSRGVTKFSPRLDQPP